MTRFLIWPGKGPAASAENARLPESSTEVSMPLTIVDFVLLSVAGQGARGLLAMTTTAHSPRAPPIYLHAIYFLAATPAECNRGII